MPLEGSITQSYLSLLKNYFWLLDQLLFNDGGHEFKWFIMVHDVVS